MPTLRAAQERGLIPENASALSVCGNASAFHVNNFHAPTAQTSLSFRYGGDGRFGKLCGYFVKHALTSVPKVAPKECIGCAKCAKICPAKAITMQKDLPQIDRSACIHCFCCQEFCPKGAMKVHRPAIARLLNR